MAGRPRNSIAFTVVVTVLSVVGAIVMILFIALSGAPSSLALATALAALPVGPLVACYLWLDRYEPEPKALLATGLVWGGFVATAATLVIQGVGGFFVPLSESVSLTVAAPVVEEAAKGFFLLLMLWWRRHELDGILDGLVYAGMVGIGFAFVENILYLAAAYNGTDATGPGGAEALTGTFILRCLVSPFAHPLFTSFIGIGVGIAVSSRSTAHPGRGTDYRVLPRGGHACTLERLHAGRHRQLLRGLRPADAARAGVHRRVRGLRAQPRAPDAPDAPSTTPRAAASSPPATSRG